MKRTVGVVPILLLSSCGLTNEQLAGIASFVAGARIPPKVRPICSPLFRDVDLRTIVIEINTNIDADVTKVDAIQSATDSCSAAASELLTAAGEDETSTFGTLEAAAYRTDCINCYVAIIDDLYDQ